MFYGLSMRRCTTRFAWLLVGTLFVALSGCGGGGGGTTTPTQEEPKVGKIIGIAADSNGSRLVGATVTIAGLTTTTDSIGEFVVSNVPVGSQQLTITSSDQSLTTTITLTVVEGTQNIGTITVSGSGGGTGGGGGGGDTPPPPPVFS